MAHEITENMIAWKNETPWHGLGVNVNPNATGEQMLIAAKMNWRVQRRTLAMRDAQGQSLLTEPLANFKAIVRSDNNRVFAIPTADYNVVQNIEIIDLFREYCEAGHATMDVVGALRGGAVVWALAKLNGRTTTSIKGVDPVTGYILFTTSHDCSLMTTGKATQTRVVCANTLAAALGDGRKAEFKLKHSAKFTEQRKAEAKEVMGIAVEAIEETNQHAEKLADVHIDHSDWLDFMGRLMGGNDAVINPKTAELTRVAADIQEATVSSPGSNLVSAKSTLWGAVNGVTYYTDHRRGRTQDTRLASAWFGDSDLMKRKAMQVAYDMATLGA